MTKPEAGRGESRAPGGRGDNDIDGTAEVEEFTPPAPGDLERLLDVQDGMRPDRDRRPAADYRRLRNDRGADETAANCQAG